MAEEQKADDITYESLSELLPPRMDANAQPNGETPIDDHSGSLKKRMQMSPKMTDTQVVDRRLFPEIEETLGWLQNLMVGRIFPETFNPLRNIIVKHLLREYPDKSFAECVVLTETVESIALDGEGRLDIIHLFSKISSGEQEEKDKLAS